MTNGSTYPPLTRFGLSVAAYTFGLSSDKLFPHIALIAAAAEATVFDSLWVPDHMLQGPCGDVDSNRGGPERNVDGPNGRTAPMLEATTLLGALAVVTNRVRLGQLVSPVTMRNPALLAKAITTLDVISGGRVLLGLGSAWDVDEHRRYGFEFPAGRDRLDRLEDGVRICRAMFDDVAATHAGKHHSINEAINVPRPVSERIPVLVGGGGEKHTLRIAAHYADGCNFPPGDLETTRRKIAVIERHCRDVGRDPGEVAKIACVVVHKLDDDVYRRVEASSPQAQTGS